MGHGRAEARNEHAGLPAEQHDCRDGEDEAQRDATRIDSVDGNREAFGENDAEEERNDGEDVCRRMRDLRVGSGGIRNCRCSRRANGNDDGEDALRYLRGSATSRD